MRAASTNPASPAISVAMSVYNGGPYLDAAIHSIRSQTFADFEFLILDDGSTDDSASIIAAHAASDARIRPIFRENRGLVASLNQLVAEARAPLVARMDADDISLPDRFARQMAFLVANPGHGVIGTDCSRIGPDGQELALPPIIRPLTHEQILANLESGPLLNHNAVIYERDAVLAVGGYRPAFAHAEDYDLWLRLSQVTRLANLPEKLVAYRIYPGQVSDRHLIEQAINASIAWLCHAERQAGRADPAASTASLPTIDTLDAVFGQGAATYARRRIINRTLYAPEALAHDGWEILLGHARETKADPRLWRLAGRMLRAGLPLHAGRLGMALLQAA